MKKIFKTRNPFFIPALSPWPLIISVALLFVVSLFISTISINSNSLTNLFLILSGPTAATFLWWTDVKHESSFLGGHSNTSIKLIKYRIIMFIVSEIIFFRRFFWAFFHRRIAPNIELGRNWPPIGIKIFIPIGIPLLNSIILLSSGATITWSHHCFLEKNIKTSIITIIITILLGIIFTFFQGLEYYNAHFSFSDSAYGSTFFLATGFHGIHVIIGTTFLITTVKRLSILHNSPDHFISIDLRAWYWHFVDVVWLFLFIRIYWWGSN